MRRSARHAVAVTLCLLAGRGSAAGQADSSRVELRATRFTVTASPRDARLARSLLSAVTARDTFPGLPRPTRAVRIDIARDLDQFRAWIGPGAPEWGAAFAFPADGRIVMQGSAAASAAGDPAEVIRHEVAHLALHEYLGERAPRWFHEGYASFAAGEWSREQVVATNLALALRGMPSLAALDSAFAGGPQRADAAYALAYLAVAELAALDPERGLTLFFSYWREGGDFEVAVRQAYGITGSAFENRWRNHTRRRYGIVAFFADATLAAGILLFVVVPFYLVRRRRDQLRMEALRRADAEQERRERESVLEAILQPGGERPPDGTTPGEAP